MNSCKYKNWLVTHASPNSFTPGIQNSWDTQLRNFLGCFNWYGTLSKIYSGSSIISWPCLTSHVVLKNIQKINTLYKIFKIIMPGNRQYCLFATFVDPLNLLFLNWFEFCCTSNFPVLEYFLVVICVNRQ